MKYIDYNIPIFKDKEKADLNLYSEEMAKAIKEQIEKFGNPIIFKGTVDTIEELNTLTNIEAGNIYSVINENKNYIYNGTSWVEYSDNIDINILEKKQHKYYLSITTAVAAGGTVTLPSYYKVGQGVLDVFLNGERLSLSSDDAGTDGHYREVGDTDSISNQIKITTDWSLEVGDYLDLVVRGEYNEAI